MPARQRTPHIPARKPAHTPGLVRQQVINNARTHTTATAHAQARSTYTHAFAHTPASESVHKARTRTPACPSAESTRSLAPASVRVHTPARSRTLRMGALHTLVHPADMPDHACPPPVQADRHTRSPVRPRGGSDTQPNTPAAHSPGNPCLLVSSKRAHTPCTYTRKHARAYVRM